MPFLLDSAGQEGQEESHHLSFLLAVLGALLGIVGLFLLIVVVLGAKYTLYVWLISRPVASVWSDPSKTNFVLGLFGVSPLVLAGTSITIDRLNHHRPRLILVSLALWSAMAFLLAYTNLSFPVMDDLRY